MPSLTTYKLLKQEHNARRGEFKTVHGTVQTPAFQNVATAGAIKGGLSAHDLKDIGAQVMLCNTYHLHLRPGDKLVAEMGGLHKFTRWNGPILTDSGGFQVFSLAKLRKITEEGVTFASHLDGHRIFMGPEESMQIQANLGSTIAMAFDECVENPAQHDYSKASCERTTRWLKRCKDEMARLKQEGVGNVDVVIECVGKPVTIEQAIQIAGHKATVMMFGLTKPDETITVKPFEVFQKELVLTSSYINPYTQRRALELIDSGRLDVSSMVAKVASLDELGAILSDPALRAMGKYIIDPSK